MKGKQREEKLFEPARVPAAEPENKKHPEELERGEQENLQ